MRGKRVDADTVQPVEAAVEVDERLCPQQAHDVDLLFQQRGAISEIDPEPLVLGGVPTDTDGEPDASTAEQVDRRDLLGDQRRLALRQHQHAGDEVHSGGERGEMAEQHEDLVERVLGRVRRGREAAERTGTEPAAEAPSMWS